MAPVCRLISLSSAEGYHTETGQAAGCWGEWGRAARGSGGSFVGDDSTLEQEGRGAEVIVNV